MIFGLLKSTMVTFKKADEHRKWQTSWKMGEHKSDEEKMVCMVSQSYLILLLCVASVMLPADGGGRMNAEVYRSSLLTFTQIH